MSKAEAEHDDLEAQIPPNRRADACKLCDGKFVFTFPDNQVLVCTHEQCNPIYTTLYQHRWFLPSASFSIIPTPDGDMVFRLSGEGAVLLLADQRKLRKQLGMLEPPKLEFFREQE